MVSELAVVTRAIPISKVAGLMSKRSRRGLRKDGFSCKRKGLGIGRWWERGKSNHEDKMQDVSR